MTLRRNLKHNFLAFSTGAKSQDLVTRKGKGLPPKVGSRSGSLRVARASVPASEHRRPAPDARCPHPCLTHNAQSELNTREERLVGDFLQLMAAARFHLTTKKASHVFCPSLSLGHAATRRAGHCAHAPTPMLAPRRLDGSHAAQEWDIAMSERFMFQLPVKVNWDFFDTKMLSSFWNSSPERAQLRTQLPHMADRVLIFHRGVSLAEDSGLFINQKVQGHGARRTACHAAALALPPPLPPTTTTTAPPP